jgi:SAM-dependent methyltransferase
MNEVTLHYDTLLAQHYSWMVGVPFSAKVAEQRALLERLGVGGRSDLGRSELAGSGLAVDLGCGPGFQSVALGRLGCAPVLAVDSCQALLNELATHASGLPIKTVCADMRELPRLVAPGSAAVIVCMGDTLTHLESREDASRLLADAYEALAPKGQLVLTFRDLSVELKGLDRFLPVRSDPDRIMTCVLEYETDHVLVNDLIYVRQGDAWTFHKSGYRKLRLGVEPVLRELRELGFAVQRSQAAGGLQAIVATK